MISVKQAPLLLACLLVAAPWRDAAAQVIEAYLGAQVQIQDPPGSAWRSVPASSLPAGARVLAREPLSHVVIELDGRRIWVRERDLRLSASPAPSSLCPPGFSWAMTRTAGRQGLGADGECVRVNR